MQEGSPWVRRSTEAAVVSVVKYPPIASCAVLVCRTEIPRHQALFRQGDSRALYLNTVGLTEKIIPYRYDSL